jgi:hypothetical protein
MAHIPTGEERVITAEWLVVAAMAMNGTLVNLWFDQKPSIIKYERPSVSNYAIRDVRSPLYIKVFVEIGISSNSLGDKWDKFFVARCRTMTYDEGNVYQSSSYQKFRK